MMKPFISDWLNNKSSLPIGSVYVIFSLNAHGSHGFWWCYVSVYSPQTGGKSEQEKEIASITKSYSSKRLQTPSETNSSSSLKINHLLQTGKFHLPNIDVQGGTFRCQLQGRINNIILQYTRWIRPGRRSGAGCTTSTPVRPRLCQYARPPSYRASHVRLPSFHSDRWAKFCASTCCYTASRILRWIFHGRDVQGFVHTQASFSTGSCIWVCRNIMISSHIVHLEQWMSSALVKYTGFSPLLLAAFLSRHSSECVHTPDQLPLPSPPKLMVDPSTVASTEIDVVDNMLFWKFSLFSVSFCQCIFETKVETLPVCVPTKTVLPNKSLVRLACLAVPQFNEKRGWFNQPAATLWKINRGTRKKNHPNGKGKNIFPTFIFGIHL